MNHYHLYGLTLHATLACPELPSGGEDPPDVILREGRAPAALANPKRQGVCFQATAEQVLLQVPGVARFLISAGREILIDREPGSDDASVRGFLLDLAIGAILQQRGRLTLHASAVARQGKGIVLAGGSGLGKSTLAAGLNGQGFPLIADEICAITLSDQGEPWLLPGRPQLHLWPEALAALGKDPAALPSRRPQVAQRVLDVTANFYAQPAPLERIYILTDGGDLAATAIEPVAGAEACRLLLAHSFQPHYLVGTQRIAKRFQQFTALGGRVPVRRVRQVNGLSHLHATLAMLAADCAA